MKQIPKKNDILPCAFIWLVIFIFFCPQKKGMFFCKPRKLKPKLHQNSWHIHSEQIIENVKYIVVESILYPGEVHIYYYSTSDRQWQVQSHAKIGAKK